MKHGWPADTWFKQRRPEVLKLFQTEIFRRVPDNAPNVKWQVAATDLLQGHSGRVFFLINHRGCV